MRRSAAAATLALALLATVASVAVAKGDGTVVVKVKAPAVGKAAADLITIKVTGPKPGPPKLKVTNLAALGKGFGGAAAITGPKHPSGHSATYKALLLLFMGNAGKASTGTIQLQVTPPAGDSASASKPADASHNCSAIKAAAKEAKHPSSEDEMLDDSGSIFGIYVPSMAGVFCP